MTIFYQYIFVPIIFEVLTKFSPIIFVCQYHYHTSTFSFHRKKGTYFGSIRHLIHQSTQHCVIISRTRQRWWRSSPTCTPPTRTFQVAWRQNLSSKELSPASKLGRSEKTRLTLETYISWPRKTSGLGALPAPIPDPAAEHIPRPRVHQQSWARRRRGASGEREVSK